MMVQATQEFRQVRAAQMRNTLRPVGLYARCMMKVFQGVAYREIKIEDIKDVKIKIDLDFVYSNQHGTCDPSALKSVSQRTTFKELCLMVLEGYYPKGYMPCAMA